VKVTKERLKQIIKEELENIIVSEAPPTATQPAAGGAATTQSTPEGGSEVKQERDVDVVLTYIKKIDQPKEYEQLISALIQHGAQIRSGKLILTKLARNLAQHVRKMK
jgi:hypothetical protein